MSMPISLFARYLFYHQNIEVSHIDKSAKIESPRFVCFCNECLLEGEVQRKQNVALDPL